MVYTVIYKKRPTSWAAYVPDLPDVISAGDSRDEVERPIQEAILFHLEGMRGEGMAIPPASFAAVAKSNLRRDMEGPLGGSGVTLPSGVGVFSKPADRR